METKHIVEINGIKMEVDFREATTINSYKIGDNIKVLKKQYSDSWVSYPGVIVGFDEFPARPTIIIAYLKLDYAIATIEWCYLNSESKDIEICLAKDGMIPIEKARVLELLDRQVLEFETKIQDLKVKKEYFLNNFNRYFEVQK